MTIQTLLIKLEVTQHVLNHAHLGTDGSWLVGLSDRKAETVQKSHFAMDTL